MKTYKQTGTVEEKMRIESDKYGNPRYYADIDIGADTCLRGNLGTGSPDNYGNWSEGDEVEVEYHFTLKGNIIFDRIEKREAK